MLEVLHAITAVGYDSDVGEEYLYARYYCIVSVIPGELGVLRPKADGVVSVAGDPVWAAGDSMCILSHFMLFLERVTYSIGVKLLANAVDSLATTSLLEFSIEVNPAEKWDSLFFLARLVLGLENWGVANTLL